MGQKIKVTQKKYWRKKQPTRGTHEKECSFGGIWLRAAMVRAIKTVAQTAAATIGTSAVLSDVNWKVVVSSAVLSGVLSLLTSIAGLPEVNQEIYSEDCENLNIINEEEK